MFCNRCGKKFASGASVQNHQNQLSSKCWKTYSLLLNLQRQPSVEINLNEPPPSLPSFPSNPSTPPPGPHDLEADSNMESPPPTPSFLVPEVDDIDDQLPHLEAAPSFHTELFLGSSEIFGDGETYLDIFDEDEYADAWQTNLYYPFASQPEWELASFLLKSDLSRVAIDQFLMLQIVSIMQSIEV